MIIDVKKQIQTDSSFPLDPIHVYTGSALPVEVVGVPRFRGQYFVKGVKVDVSNADGIVITADAIEWNDGSWRCVFAAANFTSYGRVDNGFGVSLVVSDGTVEQIEKIGRGIVEIMASTSSVAPGTPGVHYQVVGADEYHKSVVVDGVQHYKKVTIAYDAEMGDWGFNLSGDYILSSDGEYVQVVNS